MNPKRKQRLKEKRLAREKFFIENRRLAKLDHLQQTLMKKSPGSFIASFYFSPEEIGITPAPSQEAIEKLGLERAMQRLDRADFFTHVAVRVKGENTKEHLAKVREEVRQSTFEKVRAGTTGLDLSEFTTTAGVPDEVQPPTD